MQKFKNYQNTEKIYDSSNFNIYKARHNNIPVVIKVLNKKNPSLEEEQKFFQESNFIHLFFDEHISKSSGQSKIDGQPAVILEMNPGSKTDTFKNSNKSTDENTSLFFAHYYLLIYSYMFENYKKAHKHLEIIQQYINKQTPTNIILLLTFFDSLTLLALYPSSNKSQQKKIIKKVKKNQAKNERWVHDTPMKFSHKFHLVEAEISAIQGKINSAAKYYDKAIRLANENKSINVESLSLELAAKFWIEQNNNNIAKHYMTRAYHTYLKCEALTKMIQIKDKYNQFIEITSSVNSQINHTTSTHSTTGTNESQSMNLTAVINVSQTMASETNLTRLYKGIIIFCLKNTRAERAFLIIKNEKTNNYYIEAEAEVENKIKLQESIPIKKSKKLCVTIVDHVINTEEFLILNNVARDGDFTKDPYVVNNKIQSLLCVPIMHKSKISGILYMENNSSINAFPESRSEILQILSSQASISIENARLLLHRENSAKLEREMEIAANIQMGLLPENPKIAGYEVIGYMDPADKVGGDYYDFIHVDGKDWIIIGDVSGHGVPAGLVMMMVQTSIHVALEQNPSIPPSELLEIINKVIRENLSKLEEDKYMTITVFALHENGKLTFSGLHQDIMIFRDSLNKIEFIDSDGVLIGLQYDLINKFSDNTLKMNPGDTMLLYTDGITESWEKGSIKNKRDPKTQMFGIKKLTRIFQKHGRKNIVEIKNTIIDELQEYQCDDDVTMVLVRRMK